MAFDNVHSILKSGCPISSWKLLLAAAARSRPKYRALSLGLLRPFTHNGEVLVQYRCYNRNLRCFIRLSELESDIVSFLELSVGDTYNINFNFQPDLVIDGGGNIGLFTLRAAVGTASAGSLPVRLVVCEPMPGNIAQIRKHLEINNLSAEIIAGCLGGERRTIPFYCRDAIDSSFDPEKPYTSVVDMPVYSLQDLIGTALAKRILIKLDIEGMEIEVLNSFLPGEQRPVYIVGELHNFAANASLMRRTFQDHCWPFEFRSITDDHATFRACSPSALQLLPEMASIQQPVPN
jgi:FkbM family methyltransferase